MLTPINIHDIRNLLNAAKTIAVVGLSPKQERPSNMVARYLLQAGYRVIPVNPGHERILGLDCYPDLTAVPEDIDIVDIFRKSGDVPPIVEQAIAVGARAVWMQQNIVNEAAADRARQAGLICIMDRCIKVDHAQFCG